MISKEDMQNFDDYSKWVEDKIITDPQDRLNENVLGLCEEAGEVAGKIKKRIRDKLKVTPEAIIGELGDVLFYTTALANYYNANLTHVMLQNMMKLNGREARGTLKGSGDNR
jgi:NTP pyrophosphatase (non-canonical NTP hydrolase)|tara:strand:- start:95 stop:430 length:336 start_codon:yes stop_codon:yes gene_type:complete